MEQRHQRLIAAAGCIWLLTAVALVSGQAEPDVTELRLAAEQGNADAVTELRLAAEQGNADAQFHLGGMYGNGRGVPQDYGEAVRWYRLAAEQGHADAQFSLGIAYANGEGVPQDYGEAVRWWRLAAEQGHAAAQNNLGVMYGLGRGVPQDYVAAHMWANLAAAQGHEDARGLRDRLAEEMSSGAACETPGAGGLAQSSILLVNTHSPWIADWMPAPEDRRHAERWK